jgi:hypothetical protein
MPILIGAANFLSFVSLAATRTENGTWYETVQSLSALNVPRQGTHTTYGPGD